MEENIAGRTSLSPSGTDQQLLKQYSDFKRQQAADEAIGKEQGGQLANIENAKAGLDQSLSLIDTIKKHPIIVGDRSMAGRVGPSLGGQADVVNMINQLSGQIVTNVMQSFKNTGIRLNLQEVQQLKQGADRLSASRVTNMPIFNRALTIYMHR